MECCMQTPESDPYCSGSHLVAGYLCSVQPGSNGAWLTCLLFFMTLRFHPHLVIVLCMPIEIQFANS
jgi:hypothetical protein